MELTQEEWKPGGRTNFGPRQMALTAERLHELFHYDPITGFFTWKRRLDIPNYINKRFEGKRAGHTVKAGKTKGYRIITINLINFRENRLVFLYMTGDWPTNEAEHKNMLRWDNRWENLRDATPAQNSANVGMRSNNTTGFKGVFINKQNSSFFTVLKVGGRVYKSTGFKTAEEAYDVYCFLAEKYCGEFARLR